MNFALYFVAINSITFCAFFWDKYQAMNNGWRVRETTLLTMSFLGGSPAAKYAQYSMRHKTRKQPFADNLNGIFVFQVVVIPILAIPAVRHVLADFLAAVFAKEPETRHVPVIRRF